MKKGNIIRFTIDRARYKLPPLRATDCIFLIGKVLYINRDNTLRIKLIDLFGDCNEHIITIERERVVSVI